MTIKWPFNDHAFCLTNIYSSQFEFDRRTKTKLGLILMVKKIAQLSHLENVNVFKKFILDFKLAVPGP